MRRLQVQYDRAYVQYMYAKGNVVPGGAVTHRRQPVMSRSHRFANVHKGWHSCRAKRGAPTMQRCGSPVENEFEQFLHALPPDWAALMRDLGAFTYAGKIRSPEEPLH